MSTKGSSAERIGVGVIGGSGYIGGELLRYLSIHPRVEIRWASAKTKARTPVVQLYPNLTGFVGGEFIPLEEAERRMAGIGAVFVSLPHNESQDVIPRLAAAHPETTFIDMGGDFRTDDPAGYREYYDREHAAPEWLPRFVYGFTEFQRGKLAGAKLIANPGCFATSMLLALAPVAAKGRLPADAFLTGVTGSSGSGNTPSATTHHPERAANFRSYKPLAHQHLLEVLAFLKGLGARDPRVHFIPQSGPFVRGIFLTAFLPGLPAAELEKIYREAYGEEALISLGKGSPDLRWVQSTPRSHVGVSGNERTSVAFVAIDNLGKGAAGQAIQNFNLALGFPETEGLLVPGGFV